MANVGTSGNDTLSGGNPILGLGGADSLSTSWSAGFLDGGAGNDTVTASYVATTTPFLPSTDYQLVGGNGNDSLTVTSNITNDGTAVNYSPAVFADGGQGNDTISINQNVDLFDTTFTTFPWINAKTTVIDKAGNNTVSIQNSFVSADNFLDALTTVVMGSGADNVTVNNDGEANNYTPDSDHYIDLGGGNDTLSLTDEEGYMTSVVYAGNGDDSLTTTFTPNEGNDNGIGWDILQDTGAGNDTVQVTLNPDSSLDNIDVDGIFDLGGGNDSLKIDTGVWGDFTIDTGQGTNVVEVTYQPTPSFLPGDASVDITGGGGKDTITIDGYSELGFEIFVNTNIDTGFGDDVINITETGSNVVNTGDNNDLINIVSWGSEYGFGRTNLVDGGNGNDTISVIDLTPTFPGSPFFRTNDITGGSGNDQISSTIIGDGVHLITGDGGHDLIEIFGGLYGGFTDAIIDGGTGADTIISNAGDDSIAGGGGNDVINGSLGDDTMTGNAGADTFVFSVSTNDGDDVITDWNKVVDVLDVDLVDLNANGLVDEFDAQATYSVLGTDLIASFAAGGSITFEGAASGPVTSIADIMTDPALQLI